MRFFRSQKKLTPCVRPDSTIGALLSDRFNRVPDSAFAYQKTSLGTWQKIDTTEAYQQISRVAKGLLGLGLKPGQTVAIFGATSYEWMILDLAVLSIGAVSVPIYESDSAAQIAFILSDAEIQLAVAGTVAQQELLQTCGTQPLPLGTYAFSAGALQQLADHGTKIAEKHLEQVRQEVSLDDLATIVYTSGTTGNPKGVELTHANFTRPIYSAQFVVPQFFLRTDAKLLLFLPTAHVLARFVQIAAAVSDGSVGHVSDLRNLLADLKSFAPTALLAVPRVLEKVSAGARAKADSLLKKLIFNFSERTAVEFSQCLESGKPASLRLRLRHKLADRLVFSKLRQTFGGNLELLVCGGAPLSANLGHFFRGAGVDLVEGYGLTETTGPATINHPGKAIMGTVGPLLHPTEISFSPDGEVLLRGPQVMRGYHNLPEETAAVLSADGWFKTGDLGHLDGNNHLVITGRAKEMIVTAGGKNVAPGPLEEALRAHPLVSHALVVGDGRNFISALITLDPLSLRTWCAQHQLPALDLEAAAQHPRVQKSLQKAVTRANQSVSRAESIREFRILPVELTEENGLLTPSLKVKRERVLQRFAEQVEQIYQK